MQYNVDVEEVIRKTGEPWSKGMFRAVCRENGISVEGINAEHDICHSLTILGHPDGPVQFWRGTTPSLSHGSIHTMGRFLVSLNKKNSPYRLRKRWEAVAGHEEQAD